MAKAIFLDRETAIETLRAGSAYERLKAARFFSRNAAAADEQLLIEARRVETVSYVKASLDLAILRLAQQSDFDLPAKEQTDAALRRARREATEWISGLLLHEIASPIGRLALAASREVSDFENSQTKSRLDQLKQVLQAIEFLKGATAVSKPQEFDLAQLVHDIVAAEAGGQRDDISIQGPSPFVITNDPALIALGVTNGLRNALEAVQGEAKSTIVHPVVLTWGATDVDYWLAITDAGPGLKGTPDVAFSIGTTSKDSHSGFGLSIAKQAMESVNGRVILSSPRTGGVVYELRWEQ